MATNKREREANLVKKRKMARNRFRNLIRSVVINRIWLMDMGEQKFSLNVKKNIAMLVRTKRKIGLLTMAKVRARLVPVITFMVMAPGRIIIEEGDPATTIYFVLTGEVEITKRVWDRLRNKYVDKVDFICGPGDVLGDIELLENTPRKNTFVATTDVEVLVVFNEDFNRILRPVMIKQWMEKKTAIKALHYFDFLNEEQIIIACKLAIVRQFEPLETICYEDKGQVSYVHFVISGECMILQCLKMRVTQRRGRKLYDLVHIGKDDQDSMFQDLRSVDLLKKLKEGDAAQNTKNYNLTSQIDTSSEEAISDQASSKKPVRRMDIKAIEIACGLRKSSAELLSTTQDSLHSGVAANLDETEPTEFTENATDPFGNMENEEITEVTEFGNLNEDAAASEGNVLATNNKEELIAAAQVENRTSVGSIDASKSKTHLASGVSFSKLTLVPPETDVESNDKPAHQDMPPKTSSHVTVSAKFPNVDSKIENHFIDVGSMNFGGIFGLGEKLEHRVIMARTTVQCLLVPRFWLLEKEQNPGNVWQRRRYYLDSTIPSRDSLFKDFLITHKWQKFKNDLIQNINQNSIGNPTKVQDVPVICRIVEANDD